MSEDKKLKVFEMNDCEWVAHYSIGEAIYLYQKEFGGTDPENWIYARELSKGEMRRLKFVTEEDDSKGNPRKISFAKQLSNLKQPGYFATTEF